MRWAPVGGGYAIYIQVRSRSPTELWLQIKTLPLLLLLPPNPQFPSTKSSTDKMGNCQAIDSATLVIQHPNGRVDRLYLPVAAAQIMKSNPGHYVALLLTTTVYSSAAAAKKPGPVTNTTTAPLRVTRIKLLRPNDTLALGHVYRLVTTQEVMKGLWAKKQAKVKQQQQGYGKIITEKISSDFEAEIRKSEKEKIKQVKHERQRSRNSATPVNSGASKSRGWQPSLKAISEAAS